MARYFLEGPITQPDPLRRAITRRVIAALYRRLSTGATASRVRAITPGRTGDLRRAFRIRFVASSQTVIFDFDDKFYWQVLNRGRYKAEVRDRIIREIKYEIAKGFRSRDQRRLP